MHGSVSTSLIRLIHDYVNQRGLRADQVLGEPPPSDETGLSHVPMDRWLHLLQRTQQAVDEPAVGLAIASVMASRHGGLMAYLTQSCATVGEALLHMHKYERLVYDFVPGHFSFDLKSVSLKWGTENGRLGQLSDECLMGVVMVYMRCITDCPDLAPIEVRFVNPVPVDLRPYEAFFGCPVHFDSPVTILRLPLLVLTRRLVRHDTALRDLLERQAAELLKKLPPADVFNAELQSVIAGLLPSGSATASHCAKRLNCSTRTLQRQLATRGVTFQSVLDQTRERLAESYMADPKLKLADIALMLGYVDQAAFTRAFTRWKGESPARWRKARFSVADGQVGAGPTSG